MFEEKIRVEIITEQGLKRRKVPIKGTTVEIEKPSKGNVGYYPRFNREGILMYSTGKWIFKRHHKKLMLLYGASECIKFTKDSVDMATWDKKTEENLFKANVIKSAGETTQKVMIPIFVYLLFMAIIILQIFNMLLASGRIRFV
jgi:hypothetical protein